MPSLSLDLILITQLIRNGTLDADDIDRMAAQLDRQGDEDTAHQVRCCILAAMDLPSVTLQIIDGGNRDD